jgi:opacity protein-like surface antigen
MLIGSGLQALATSGKFKPVTLGQIRTAGNNSSVIIPGIGGVGGRGTIDQTVSGWMLGVGTEYALGGNWTAKVEYNMMDFGNNNPFADNTFHVFKAGINYRFGGFGGIF